MNFSDLVVTVCDDSNNLSTISTVSARVKREINRVCEDVWNGFAWSFRWRNYRIVTDIDVTAGTVSLTNGSRTVTGSGTSFLSSHATWHISFPGDAIPNWYRVKSYTSGVALELDVPYQGTSGSGKTYILRHMDYVLPTEALDLGSLMVTNGSNPVDIIDPYSMDIYSPFPVSNGGPVAVSIYGSDSKPTVYSTGTVSGTVDTTTLTGVTTSWLDNVNPGDKVTLGSYDYTVLSVDSNTQITLYQKLQATSSSASYSIKKQFGRILRIVWPSTYNLTLDIRALRKYQPLVNDADTNEILDRFPNAITLKVAALEIQGKNDVRGTQLDQRADTAIMKAQSEDGAMTPKTQTRPIFSYRTRR